MSENNVKKIKTIRFGRTNIIVNNPASLDFVEPRPPKGKRLNKNGRYVDLVAPKMPRQPKEPKQQSKPQEKPEYKTGIICIGCLKDGYEEICKKCSSDIMRNIKK